MRSTARSPAATSTPDATYAVRSASPLPPCPGASATGRHRFLEDELAAGRVVRHGLRVVPVEAGEAEPFVRQLEGLQDPADRQVAERVRADERADLGLGVGG